MVEASKHILRISGGGASVVGVLDLHPIYEGALLELLGKGEREVRAFPFRERWLSPWISVRERLPEEGRRVICRLSEGTAVSGVICLGADGSPALSPDGGAEVIEGRPEAWMPMPD